MKLKEYIPTFTLIVLLFICLIVYYVKGNDYEESTTVSSSFVVPTMISDLKENTIWCSTLNLVWNDLKELNGGDISLVNTKNNQTVNDLNQVTFDKNDLNSDSYYTKYGFMNPSLKEEIEKDIKEKFNETSVILNDFNFTDDSKDYLLYSMLVKKFKFEYPFDILTRKTFGIENGSSHDLDKNVKVLFYEDSKSYAVLLETTTDDEIILVKGLDGKNFEEIYNKLDLNKNEDFKENDTITMSNINFTVKKDFYDLRNLDIKLKDKNYTIGKSLQVINFNFDNEGGEVKSEDGLELNYSASSPGRFFNFEDDFILFAKEIGKEKPYLAIKVKDINKFQ